MVQRDTWLRCASEPKQTAVQFLAISLSAGENGMLSHATFSLILGLFSVQSVSQLSHNARIAPALTYTLPS